MEHYYSENPQSNIKEIEFSYNIKGIELDFTSVSGVFAFTNKVDKATELLIKNYRPSGAGNFLLDIGCGIGPISLYIKARYPHIQVTAVDINERALHYTGKNAQRNNLSIEVLKSNLYSELNQKLFGDILTNPPIAAGKKVNTNLITDAKEHLLKDGALWLVAFHNKGGSTLKKIMHEVFGNVEDIEKKGGVRVYRSVNLL